MSWTNLKAGIANVIKFNGNQEITGNALQGVLNTIVNSIGAYATFVGVAVPSTNPGTPDGPVFYIAGQPGIYSNFGNTPFTVSDYILGVFLWNGITWSFTGISIGDISSVLSQVNSFSAQLRQLELETVEGKIKLYGLSGAGLVKTGIMSTTKWSYMTNTAYEHVAVPVKSGDVVTIKAVSAGTPIAVLTAYDNPESNDNIAFSLAEGFTSRIVIYANAGVKTYTMPSDAKYFCINTKNNGSSIMPTNLTVNGANYLSALANTVATNTSNISSLNTTVGGLSSASTSHGTAITSLDGRVSNVEGKTLAEMSPIDKFEIGHINISDTGWSYSANTARARTKQDTTLSIKKGDVIGLTDYTNYRYVVGILRDGNYYVLSWQTSNYTFSNDCAIVVLISRITNETALDNVEELASLFFIKPYDSIANDVKRLRTEAITADKLRLELKGGSIGGTDLPFEIGHVAISTTGWSFGANNDRARLNRYNPLNCSKGDVLSLSDYTDYRMAIGWRVGTQYEMETGWLKADFTCPKDAEYMILIARNQNAETALSDVTELSSLFTWTKKGLSVDNVKLRSIRSIAHQGYPTTSNPYGSNLAEAYIKAAEMGFDFGECDLQFSSDGVPFCCHPTKFSDSDVWENAFRDPVSLEKVYFAENTAAQIKEHAYIDADHTCSTFEEVIAACKSVGIGICLDKIDNITDDTKWAAVFSILKRYAMLDKTIFAVTPEATANKVLSIYPNAEITFLRPLNAETIAMANRVKTVNNKVSIDTDYTGVTVQGIIAAYETMNPGITLMLYTIDATATYKTFLPYVSGIISNKISEPML